MAANAVTGTEERTSGNGRALASLLLGLAATATMPLAILATRYSASYKLLQAGFAIPVAVVLGALAIGLARGALRLDDMRLGRAGGRQGRAARPRARRARHLPRRYVCGRPGRVRDPHLPGRALSRDPPKADRD